QQQNFEAAKGYFREITRRSPWDARAWEFLSVLYFQEGQPDSVILLLEEGLFSLPNEFSLLSLYGSALQQVNRISEAVDPLEKAHRLEPEDFNTIVSLGIVYDELKMYQPLDSLYQSALARFPNNALLLNNYSYSLSVRGVELEKALEMSQKALQNEPDNAAYYDTAGWIYFKMGHLEKARELIEQSLVMEPDNPEVIEHLGDVYEKLGNLDLAKQFWQQALELAPDNPELREKWLQN
ncbi:MAG: tetratricopeptide repeat protein, partial [Calditrichaeota bacterium]|nr:tetratricopeptide repeat protein [Calditrichota bacterium]